DHHAVPHSPTRRSSDLAAPQTTGSRPETPPTPRRSSPPRVRTQLAAPAKSCRRKPATASAPRHAAPPAPAPPERPPSAPQWPDRSEEHTSELQSRENLV